MAKKDWKKALQDKLDQLGDQVRDWFDALEGVLSPPPDLVPVPVRPEDRRR